MAVVATAAAPPPAVIAPYIHDGHFAPGDFGWMRGGFDDASPAQKAQWQALGSWETDCMTAAQAVATRDLAALGIAAPTLRMSTYGDVLCGEVTSAMPRVTDARNWLAFHSALAEGRRVGNTIVWSAKLAQTVADPEEQRLANQLHARPMMDQVLRGALSWENGVKDPPLPEGQARSVAEAVIWSAIRARDADNTVWLENTVAEQGWPTISKVGAEASGDAWLLVQHADDDPAFQLRMLRLMEPLATKGEVSRKNYGFLYDRVMLQVAGKQRYATQMHCEAGHYVPFPLEDAAHVDALRKAAGMSTVAENAKRLDDNVGHCPTAPLGTASVKR